MHIKTADMKKPVPQANEKQAVNHNENERQITLSGSDLITDGKRKQQQPKTLDQPHQGTGTAMATRKIRGFNSANLQSSSMGEGVSPWGGQTAREDICQKIETGREHGTIEKKTRA